MRPFLKWAGGKRWLAKQLADSLPPTFGRYVEPFLGSGALFFEILPTSATLSDVNEALIVTYRAVRDHPDEIFDRLSVLHRSHNKQIYYQQRALNPTCIIERAVRFIYLNRTCWNGLYRVNRQNEFNVPIGTKSSVILPDDDFYSIAAALKDKEIFPRDFQISIDLAQSDDVIYVDPPYTARHNMNGFLKYNHILFSWNDQVRLHDSLARARDRGCHIVMSNADHHSIRELYRDFSLVRAVPRTSVIAGSADYRGPTTELLVVHRG